VVRNRGVLALGLIIMCSSFNSYFYFNWFPTYLESAHGISNKESGWFTSLALAGAAAGVLTGGVIADRILKRSASPLAARRAFCGAAFVAGAAFLFSAIRSESVTGLGVLAALSCLCVQLTLPSWWSAAIEQSGRHVGPVFGLLNTLGTVGALTVQGFVGVFADWQESRGLTGRAQWDPLFDAFVGVLLVGAFGWWVLYRRVPIDGPPEPGPVA
jgi:cyanate permease